MIKTKFATAHEVRRFIKDAGYTDRLKIQWFDSPFGGPGHFSVKLLDQPPSTIITSFGSDHPVHFFCSDKDLEKKMRDIHTLLKETNAHI
jgi:hypothetical protein